MTRMKKITFLGRHQLEKAVLELVLWETPPQRYVIHCDDIGFHYYIRTTSNDVVDVIVESLPTIAYEIEKEIK